MPRLSEIGERAALARLKWESLGSSHVGIVVGIGDDAAVLRPSPGMDLVATTDTFVEGRHWRVDTLEPWEVGARLAAANLSDIAAMAARPRWALVSMGVRGDHDVDALMELERGIAALISADGCGIAGGNLVAVDGEEWFGLTLLGEVAPGRAWRRVGAAAGDWVAVTGHPGRAGAAWRLAARAPGALADPAWAALRAACVEPAPRLALARSLAAVGCVHAAIDVSDGFAGDLGQLCAASGVGAEIEAARWPADAELERAAQALGADASALAVGASDDYELLLAIPDAARAEAERLAHHHGAPLAFVGRFVSDAAAPAWIGRDGARGPLEGAGFDHFGSNLG